MAANFPKKIPFDKYVILALALALAVALMLTLTLALVTMSLSDDRSWLVQLAMKVIARARIEITKCRSLCYLAA